MFQEHVSSMLQWVIELETFGVSFAPGDRFATVKLNIDINKSSLNLSQYVNDHPLISSNFRLIFKPD